MGSGLFMLKSHVLWRNPLNKLSKLMSFAFWGVLKDLLCKQLFQHTTRSSWSLLNRITCLFMQALSNSIRNAQSFLLSSTWVFLLVMRIYCLQCISNVWCATKHAHSLYEWLVYHLHKMYFTCPEDMTRHSALLDSVV